MAQQIWQYCVLDTLQAISTFRKKCRNLGWVQMEGMKE